MPTLQYPENDTSRHSLLNMLVETGEEELRAGKEHIPRHMLDEIARLATLFGEAFSEVNSLSDKKVGKVAKRQEAVKTLELFLRAFRSGVLWRVKIYNWAPAYKGYFNIQTRIPSYAKDTRWLQVAETYLRGEELAVEKGYLPMANPSANELRAKYHKASEHIRRARQAGSALDRTQHQLAGIRQEVDALFRLVSKRLDFALYELPADDIRHIKRRYGFRYRNDSPIE